MTFSLQRPVTQGYGDIVSQSGKVLGQISGVKDAMGLRFAGEGLRQAAEDKKLDYLLETYKLGMQPQQGQGGQGGTDWLGLAKTGLSIAGGLGAFGGGGAAAGAGLGGDSFAGVDNSVLDSVLGNAGTYSSGMTSLF